MIQQQEPPRRQTCPFAGGRPFEPYSVAATADPEPWLSAARRERPVFWAPEIGAYCVTRYDDIVSVLTAPHTFSSTHMLRFRPIPESLRDHFPDGQHPGAHSLTYMAPREHGRIRRLANQAFTPRRVAEMEPRITELADRLISSFAAAGEVDLLAAFTQQLPMLIMRDIAGVAEDSDLDFNAWGPDYFALTESAPPLTEERIAAIGQKSGRILRWFREYVAYRTADPGDDLISALIRARTPEGDASLEVSEVIAILSAMLSAGIETTAHFIPQVLRRVLTDRELYGAVLRDRSLIPKIVEESLRVYPASRGIRRTAVENAVVGGVPIPAGADVFLYLVSANRDEDVFPESAEFDVERPNADRHLAFGRGIHFCLGAPLARLESRVAIDRLLTRLPDLRLADDRPAEWEPNITVPRLKHFKIAWTPAA